MKKEYDMSKAKRGTIIKGKTRVTLYLDNDIIKYFRDRAENLGKGYQTLMNQALSEAMKNQRVDSVDTLRRVIREELKRANK